MSSNYKAIVLLFVVNVTRGRGGGPTTYSQ